MNYNPYDLLQRQRQQGLGGGFTYIPAPVQGQAGYGVLGAGYALSGAAGEASLAGRLVGAPTPHVQAQALTLGQPSSLLSPVRRQVPQQNSSRRAPTNFMVPGAQASALR